MNTTRTISVVVIGLMLPLVDPIGVQAYYRVGFGYGFGGAGGYGGGTPQSYYLNGMSNVIRAQGQAAVGYSQAAVNVEEARSRYIDNQKKWSETYLEMKRSHDAAVEEKQERDKELLQTHLANRKPQTPARLSFAQLDPGTGRITWPVVLRSDEYATARQKIEDLFALRARVNGSVPTSHEISVGVADLRALLRARISAMSPNEYIAARKFLDSLAYEGTLLGE